MTMTRQEAIHELQEDKSLYETEVCHAGDGTPDGHLLEALDMAIEALSEPKTNMKSRNGLYIKVYADDEPQDKEAWDVAYEKYLNIIK